MPISLDDTLVIAISSTALFDLSEPDKIYRDAREKLGDDKAIGNYRQHMFDTEDDELKMELVFLS